MLLFPPVTSYFSNVHSESGHFLLLATHSNKEKVSGSQNTGTKHDLLNCNGTSKVWRSNFQNWISCDAIIVNQTQFVPFFLSCFMFCIMLHCCCNLMCTNSKKKKKKSSFRRKKKIQDTVISGTDPTGCNIILKTAEPPKTDWSSPLCVCLLHPYQSVTRHWCGWLFIPLLTFDGDIKAE